MSSFENNINPFETETGADRMANKNVLLWVFSVATIVAVIIAMMGMMGLFVFLGLFVVVGIVYGIFDRPKRGILLLVILGFFVTGLARYITAPWGLTMDVLLVLIYISLFFKGFAEKIKWSKAKSSLTLLVSIWIVYVFLQIGNPEVESIQAWFYAMRGVALYQFLSIPLLFLLFNKQKDLNTFFIIWGLLSLLGTLKGFQQFHFGVDPFEQRWLNQGGAQTHILFGKLRVFSFYSDAGQFGASQAESGVVFGILALFKKGNFKLKAFFILVAFAGFVGMFISGTRGAIAVPALGGITLLILKKNIKILVLGSAIGMVVFIFFAYTNIGQGNAEIRRMRSAFDPNDASLQVRLDNQNKLKGYMAVRPFGGGVGATGNWGKRFTPHTFLANTATDSWYVMIWADTGVVGLVYYLFMLFFILITGGYNVMFRIKDEGLKNQITALTCGMAGIMLASYGNGVFGQMPTGMIMYISMVFMFVAPKIDQQKRKRTIERY